MSRFIQIAKGIDVTPLQLELSRHDGFWDQRSDRRTYPNSPHTAMRDIWVRYMPDDAVSLDSRRQEHRSVFWPAWNALPSLRPVVFGLMARVQAVELGSILITRLPPGKCIEPHSDLGSWAPEFYNCKAHWTVAGEADVTCTDDMQTFEAGTVWTFDNLLMHSVHNNGDHDRICAIISMRTE